MAIRGRTVAVLESDDGSFVIRFIQLIRTWEGDI